MISENELSQNKFNIELPKVINANITIFNSDVIHNIIYLVQILRKYDNVFIPFQHFIQDKSIDMLTKLNEHNFYTTSFGNIIYQFLNTYTCRFFEFLPHLILWRNIDTYYNYTDLDYYIKKTLRNSNVRFLLFKLTLIPQETVVHANIIIYDKVQNKIERFEPYGATHSLMGDFKNLDIYLKNLFKKKINENVKYLGPEDYMTDAKFQLVSSENDTKYRKYTDPVGYCLAWCFWFVELRLANPDVESKILVDEAFQKIVNGKSNEIDNKDVTMNNINENMLLSHIRNYSKKLDEYRISFYDEISINKSEYYKIRLSPENEELIFSHIIESFNKLVNERYN